MLDHLVVCETFYSVQGEGPSVGKPAVFLRLAGCNLQCAGFSYQLPETGEHLGCDSKAVWRQGTRRTRADILGEFEHSGWLQALADGAHLVITGGEPSLQQAKLIPFINSLTEAVGHLPYIELETNATVALLPAFSDLLAQINASPKLLHSGEPHSKAYNPAALDNLVNLSQCIFKFVISTPSDIDEVLQNYVAPYKMANQRIWLMPEGGTREQLHERSPWVVELCKQHRMNYSPRLQVDIWGEVTGV